MEKTANSISRHCEERSDEAIHLSARPQLMDCFASLAMTKEMQRPDNQKFTGG
jgi:hypothetical protein